MNRRLLSAATLTGYLVRNRDGEDLGCIEELMVAPNTGAIIYAILAPGGFGGRLLPVPWNALLLDSEKRVFVLDIDGETLERVPAFHEELWPDFSDPEWAHEIHRCFGLSPSAEAA
jgi:hypothetical protein